MASNPREWSVPAPVRALLWWPGVSLVLVIVVPGAAEGAIVASGLLLALVGGLAAATADRLRKRRVGTAASAATTAESDLPGTASLSAVDLAPVAIPASHRVA